MPPPTARSLVALPNLAEDEQYAGIVIDEAGHPTHHLILLPQRPEARLTWDEAMEWATDIGARLPTRQEQALLIAKAFKQFNLAEVTPADIAEFVDQWEGRRSAQSYRSHLSKFFAWCCRKGLMTTNPAREVTVEAPPQRDAYITDEQYKAIRAALLVGKDGRATPSGPMVQCYMDLLYLLYQRGTEVRLLKWSDIQPGGILFKPTKTEHTSGKKVLVPVSDDVMAVINRLRRIRNMRSIYLIHTQDGQPYAAHGIGTAFRRACERAKISGVTLKDIRAKAATDATSQGYTEQQLQTALAHTDAGTTRKYIRTRETPVSEVVMRLPSGIEIE